MLAFDNSSTLRVGTDLSTEVLEDGTLWHAKCEGYFRKVLDVCLHTVKSTFLGQLHLRHFVPVVRIVVLALRDANVGRHDSIFSLSFCSDF